MPIKITRIETLALMQELPANHFLQSRLIDELVELNKSSASRLGNREVIGGRLVVARPENTATAGSVTTDLGENQFTDSQLDEMYEAGGIAPTKQCKWQTYGYRCREESPNKFCEEHRGKICSHRDVEGVACGKPADHGCPTELQFVCGFPLCHEHSSCGHYRR